MTINPGYRYTYRLGDDDYHVYEILTVSERDDTCEIRLIFDSLRGETNPDLYREFRYSVVSLEENNLEAWGPPNDDRARAVVVPVERRMFPEETAVPELASRQSVTLKHLRRRS